MFAYVCKIEFLQSNLWTCVLSFALSSNLLTNLKTTVNKAASNTWTERRTFQIIRMLFNTLE